jgi:hypothetical protein
MGRRGFQAVDRQLAGEKSEPVVMPIEIVLRDSTAAPPSEPLPGGTR